MKRPNFWQRLFGRTAQSKVSLAKEVTQAQRVIQDERDASGRGLAAVDYDITTGMPFYQAVREATEIILDEDLMVQAADDQPAEAPVVATAFPIDADGQPGTFGGTDVQDLPAEAPMPADLPAEAPLPVELPAEAPMAVEHVYGEPPQDSGNSYGGGSSNDSGGSYGGGSSNDSGGSSYDSGGGGYDSGGGDSGGGGSSE